MNPLLRTQTLASVADTLDAYADAGMRPTIAETAHLARVLRAAAADDAMPAAAVLRQMGGVPVWSVHEGGMR